jgi:hypothetical protein
MVRREVEQSREQLQQTEQESKRTGRQSRQLAREHLLCEMPSGSVCAEIGVHEGDFSEQILSIVEPRRLHLIDPWRHEEGGRYEDSRYGGLGQVGQSIMDQRYEKVRERFGELVRNGQVRIHRSPSSSACDSFEDHYFDWIYLDGNHLYAFVERDLELYYPKVKPGGLITGDDYGARGWWNNGVQKAVDKFVEGNSELTLRVNDTQFILRKGV